MQMGIRATMGCLERQWSWAQHLEIEVGRRLPDRVWQPAVLPEQYQTAYNGQAQIAVMLM
jgi:hypothetical protein